MESNKKRTLHVILYSSGAIVLLLLIFVSIVLWRTQLPMTQFSAARGVRNETTIFSNDPIVAEKLNKPIMDNPNQPMLYMVLNNDPLAAKLRYHSPTTPLWFAKQADEWTDLSPIMKLKGHNKKGLKTTCISTNKKAKIVNLFGMMSDTVVLGAGYSRSALICQDQYYVMQYYDPIGYSIAGPFTLPE